MNLALTVALVAVNIAYIVFLHFSGQRAVSERAAEREERQMLLQRIQAPEVAVVQHQQTTLPDENPYPLSDEESAEAQNERQRMIAELERLENAGLV